MLLEPPLGGGLDAEVGLGIGEPVLVEGHLDPGIGGDVGGPIFWERSHDPEGLFRLERPRVEELTARPVECEAIDDAGKQGLVRRDDDGPIVGVRRDGEGQVRVDRQARRERGGRGSVDAGQAERDVERDHGPGRALGREVACGRVVRGDRRDDGRRRLEAGPRVVAQGGSGLTVVPGGWLAFALPSSVGRVAFQARPPRTSARVSPATVARMAGRRRKAPGP